MTRPHLPYRPTPECDDAAERYINQALRSTDTQRWTALLSDEYALQTHRVLASIRAEIDNTFVHRNAELTRSRARRAAGDSVMVDHMQVLADYDEWKRRAINFRTMVDRRYRQAADAANARRGYELANTVRDVLLILGEAVMEHRERVEAEGEPTADDRLLWARLATLRVPAEERPELLEHVVQREREQRVKTEGHGR